MKTLIENSIQLYGMGHPDVKTIFMLRDVTLPSDPTPEQQAESAKNQMDNEILLKDMRFKPLTTVSNRKMSAFFKYKENGVEKEGRVQMKMIQSDDEQAIKAFIVGQINHHLNNLSSAQPS